MGSEFLKRGGDPEGFARSLQRRHLGAENDVDYDDDQGKFFGQRPSHDDDDARDEAPGRMGGGSGVVGAFGRPIGDNPDYENDSFADRFGSESVKNRDSFGNPRRRSGSLLDAIRNIEGARGHFGGFAGHRRPREISAAAPAVAEAAPAVAQAPRRRGFFNGSWNPFKWNWRNLFGRRR